GGERGVDLVVRLAVPEHVERTVREDPAARAEVRTGVRHEEDILVRGAKVEPRYPELRKLLLPAFVVCLAHAGRDRRVVVVDSGQRHAPYERVGAEIVQDTHHWHQVGT